MLLVRELDDRELDDEEREDSRLLDRLEEDKELLLREELLIELLEMLCAMVETGKATARKADKESVRVFIQPL
jgi:hypothetical protein